MTVEPLDEVLRLARLTAQYTGTVRDDLICRYGDQLEEALEVYDAALLAQPAPSEEHEKRRADAVEYVRDMISGLQAEHEVMCGPFDSSTWSLDIPVDHLLPLVGDTIVWNAPFPDAPLPAQPPVAPGGEGLRDRVAWEICKKMSRSKADLWPTRSIESRALYYEAADAALALTGGATGWRPVPKWAKEAQGFVDFCARHCGPARRHKTMDDAELLSVIENHPTLTDAIKAGRDLGSPIPPAQPSAAGGPS